MIDKAEKTNDKSTNVRRIKRKKAKTGNNIQNHRLRESENGIERSEERG